MKLPTSILVTGCAGFIGSNFTRQFHAKFPSTCIVGLDDLSTGRKDAIQPFVRFTRGSVVSRRIVERLFTLHKPQYVFHFAALPRVSYSVEHPRETSEVNLFGTIILLDAARRHGARRFVYSSSSAIYGDVVGLPTKEASRRLGMKTPYAVQKFAGEPFCKLYSDLYGLDTVCLRYFNVYGPGQYGDSPYATVIAAWLEALYFPKKKKPFLEGDGKQTRDFVYVDDVVNANIRCMNSPSALSGEIMNIGLGSRVSMLRVKALIERATQEKLTLERRPTRVGDVRHTLASIAKAKKLIGFVPTIDIEEGIKRTVLWFAHRWQKECDNER